MFNPQNHRIWAENAPEINERVVERTQKPKSVMVCAAITSTGKTSLVFVEEGVKINRWNYMEMLEEHLLPWASDLFGDEEWCFQQDSAPAHKANDTQDWLSEYCPDFITREEWPPNSYDLNLLSMPCGVFWKKRHAQN